MNKRRVDQLGFTLMELMIAAAILVVALSGLLHAFSACFVLNETSRNQTLALNGLQEKIEKIRSVDFSTIYSTYNGTTFYLDEDGVDDPADDWFLPRQDHIGVIQVINDGTDAAAVTGSDLLQVRLVICWRQNGSRIIGEDMDLDGVLDTGEDTNANNRIDSPAELITLISNPPD